MNTPDLKKVLTAEQLYTLRLLITRTNEEAGKVLGIHYRQVQERVRQIRTRTGTAHRGCWGIWATSQGIAPIESHSSSREGGQT